MNNIQRHTDGFDSYYKVEDADAIIAHWKFKFDQCNAESARRRRKIEELKSDLVAVENLAYERGVKAGYTARLMDVDDLMKEAEQRGIQKALTAWQEAEPLHDMEVQRDMLTRCIEAVQALPFSSDTMEADDERRVVLAALRGLKHES